MRTALILAGVLWSLVAEPQEIYRWVDRNGVVHYADQPGAADAERVHIATSNRYEATPSELGDAASYGAAPAVPAYDSLNITQPAPDEVFFGADTAIIAAAELGGTLQSDHTLAFFVDGNRVPSDGGASVELPNLDRGMHFLRAAVLDQNGAPLLSSPQLTFHVREPSVQNPQSPLIPPPPKNGPKPIPRPRTPTYPSG
ncbi:MAG: DUF4124 domain-containing protein [Steroidobacteraceae bacterium]